MHARIVIQIGEQYVRIKTLHEFLRLSYASLHDIQASQLRSVSMSDKAYAGKVNKSLRLGA